MDVLSLHTVPLGAGTPDWVHLVPAGRFSGVDGRGPYVLDDPQGVIDASMADGRIPIDENHSTDLAAPRGEPAPARGWITAMEARPDGLHGRVEWTESGRALMADRAYRGISPVFTVAPARGAQRVLRVLRAALTNAPNLSDLATLNQQDTTMDLARMRTLLGLAADADEAAITAAVERHATERAAAAAQVTQLQAQMAQMQAAAVKPELVIELQAQIAEMQLAQRRAAAVACVDAAIAAGKPIAALREHFIARHMVDAASVQTELEKLPSLHAGGIDPRLARQAATGEDDDGLTADERMMAAKMKLDPKQFAAELKKARRAA